MRLKIKIGGNMIDEAIVTGVRDESDRRLFPFDDELKGNKRLCGKSILELTLDQLAKIGITQVILAEPQKMSFDNVSKIPGMRVRRIVAQTESQALNNASPYLKGKRFAFVRDDRIDAGDILQKMITAGNKTVLAGRKVSEERSKDYGIFEFADNHNILASAIREKPKIPPSRIRATAAYLLTAEFAQKIDPDRLFEDELSDYIERGFAPVVRIDDLPAITYKRWPDLLGLMNWKLGQTTALIHPGAKIDKNAKLIGPVAVDDKATISAGAVLIGPAYIGQKTEVAVGCRISGSSIGQDCKIYGQSTIANSLIDNETTVYKSRISNSVIGHGCNIEYTEIMHCLPLGRNVRMDSFNYLPDQGSVPAIISSRTSMLGTALGNDCVLNSCTIMPGSAIGPKQILLQQLVKPIKNLQK